MARTIETEVVDIEETGQPPAQGKSQKPESGNKAARK
jgi:hypothetical protein